MNAFPATSSAVRVFISYAWEDGSDGPYRDWVKDLATRLRQDGVDARLDKWHMQEGQTIPEFMNSEIRLAEKILVVCSPQYQAKVHAKEEGGSVTGSGWESMLVSSAMFTGERGAKVVAVLGKGEWRQAAPSYLQGLPYDNLTYAMGSPEFGKAYTALLQRLTGTTEQPPPIGASVPSAPASGNKEPAKWLHDLRIFIDRPKHMHQHMVAALSKSRIRGFVCVMSDQQQHMPGDFSKSLACRLAGLDAENREIAIWKAFNQYRDHAYQLPIESLSEVDSYAQFCQRVHKTLYEKNGARSDKKIEEFEGLDDVHQRERILKVVKSQMPQVAYIIDVNMARRQGLRRWFGRSEAKRVQQLCEWFVQWNKGWTLDVSDRTIAPMAIVLVLKVAPETVEQFTREHRTDGPSSPLVFQPVYEQDFSNWIAQASTMMRAMMPW